MKTDFVDRLQEDWSEQRPDLEQEPMGVALRIQALAKILGDLASERLGDLGLQWWQYDVLSALRRQGAPYALSATELADASLLTSGAMTNRIDRLEEAGLVRRRKDRRDRRKILVQLTGRGLKLIDRATSVRFEAARNALGKLSPKQLESLNALLRRVMLSQGELTINPAGEKPG
jgi:DNA-binding MarR family transcriptional regulator